MFKRTKNLILEMKSLFEVEDEQPVDPLEKDSGTEDPQGSTPPTGEKPTDEVKPETEPTEELPDEKEYLGAKGADQYFYLKRDMDASGTVNNLILIDASENTLADAAELGVDISNIPEFILAAMKKVEATSVSVDIVEKYFLKEEEEVKPEEEVPEVKDEIKAEGTGPSTQNTVTPKVPNESRVNESKSEVCHDFAEAKDILKEKGITWEETQDSKTGNSILFLVLGEEVAKFNREAKILTIYESVNEKVFQIVLGEEVIATYRKKENAEAALKDYNDEHSEMSGKVKIKISESISPNVKDAIRLVVDKCLKNGMKDSNSIYQQVLDNVSGALSNRETEEYVNNLVNPNESIVEGKKEDEANAAVTRTATSILRKIHKAIDAVSLEEVMDRIEKTATKGDITAEQETRLKAALTRRKEALEKNPQEPTTEPTETEEKEIEEEVVIEKNVTSEQLMDDIANYLFKRKYNDLTPEEKQKADDELVPYVSQVLMQQGVREEKIVEDNNETYTWGQINQALISIGMPAKRILDVLTALSHAKITSTGVNNPKVKEEVQEPIKAEKANEAQVKEDVEVIIKDEDKETNIVTTEGGIQVTTVNPEVQPIDRTITGIPGEEKKEEVAPVVEPDIVTEEAKKEDKVDDGDKGTGTLYPYTPLSKKERDSKKIKEARTIGPQYRGKIKELVRMAHKAGLEGNSEVTDYVVDNLPSEAWETWEGADSEIRRLANDLNMKIDKKPYESKRKVVHVENKDILKSIQESMKE